MPEKKNFCLIDDDPIVAFAVNRFLEVANVAEDVTVYTDGKSAFEALKETQENFPEVIFVDINMPIWNGWDFLTEIQKAQLHERAEFYILTSSMSEIDKKKAEEFPFIKEYLVKPISLKKIQETFCVPAES